MATIEGSSSSTFPVFVDTNLETHLLILVSSDDTVDDLKGKISTEHLVSFPNVGEISVKATKVKRRGFYYSLSNSMVVKKAFEGVKGAWFLHIDLVPLTSIVKSQTGLAKVIVNESDMQLDKHNLVQTGHLAVNREGMHRDSIVNGKAIDNGLIQTSVSSVLERETLPGLEKRLDREVPEMEKLVIEGNAAVGSDLQQKSKQVTYQEKKDGMGEDHENANAGAGIRVPVASKKGKSRKRHDALEIDQLPDGTPEHPYVETKKHKKEKDGSFKEFVEKTVMPENNFQEKNDNNLASSEGFSSKPSHVDSSLQAAINSKQNRKKERHILKNDRTSQNEMVNSLLNMIDDATLEKQDAEEIHVDEPIKNHMEVGKESDVADLFGSTQEVLADGKSEHPSVENKKSKEENDGSSKDLGKDLPENNFQEKQETTLASEGSSLPPPVNAKQKRKRKKHLSKINEAPQTKLVDSSLVKTDEAAQEKQVPGVDHAEELVKNHIDLRKESDAVDLMEESTEKMLQTLLPESCSLEKHGTNLASSDGTSKLFDVDSSLRAPVDAKQKRKKKKHLSKIDEASDIDNSLDKDNDAPLQKQPSEEDHVEESVNNHTELGKESDAADPIKESTPKDQDGRSSKLRTTDPLSANPNESTDTRKRNIKFPVEDENFYKASGNKQAQLSKDSEVVMADAHLADKNAVESAILSDNGTKSSHRSKRKKREKPELSNTLSNTHETVKSPGDEVPEEIQNKISSTRQEQLVGSTVLSSPIEKKKKRSQKESEKIELHHQESNIQSDTQEEVNSSVDQIIGKLTKEISIKHVEATSLREAAENSTAVQCIVPSNPNDVKSKFSLKKSAENSTLVQFIVPSNPNDKKSKRSRKKSNKVELRSGDPNRAEPVHSLVEKPEVSSRDTQSKTLGSGPACPIKESTLAAVDLTVPPNPRDKKSKRSRKKPEKAELLAEERSKDEGGHPFGKEATKEKYGNTLNDISTGVDTNSKSATICREDAGLESSTISQINSTFNGINSSRSYDHDQSLANEDTNENLEKLSGATNRSSGIELTARINPDEIGGWSMDDANTSNLVPNGYDDPFGDHETGCLSREKENIIGLEKVGEGSMDIVHDRVHNASAEAEDHRQPPKSDRTNIEIKFSNPILNQPKDVQGLPFAETETSNSNKEKTKRKKKLNFSPQDPSIYLLKTSGSEQHVPKKKPQDSDLGEHGSVAPEVSDSKELKSRKKREKRGANSIQNSDTHLYETSSGLGTHANDKIDNKLKNHDLDTHSQGSLTVDKKGKYPSGKNSIITGNKLQSSTHGEDTDIVGSATEISKQKIDDASVKSSIGGAAVANNGSNAVDSIPWRERMAGLVASSDTTEEDTPIQKKRYRVAVRKVPSKRYKNDSNKFNEEKTLLASSATIFNDASSGSSEDEFEISNRRAPVRANLDNSSTSADSDGDLGGTQTAYKNSPAGSESMYGKVDRRTNDALSSPTKTSNAKRRGKSLGEILKSTSSYNRAKLSASQSELRDSESQSFDVVPETQAE